VEILTRKYGPLPGWAWAAVAVAGGLAFFYFRGRSGSSSSGQAAGLPAVSPAASAVPFVPSVTVTGIPNQQPPAPSTGGGSIAAVVTGAGSQGLGSPSGNSALRAAPSASAPVIMILTVGTKLQLNPQAIPDPNPAWGQWYQVASGTGAGFFAWGNDLSLTPGSGGSGGYGYAGAASLASPVGGWTAGWQPFGSGGAGANSTINRTGLARPRTRRLYGGSGGGPNRAQRATPSTPRPLRRRNLSGR
jgi:hypothetical protein